MDYYIGHNRQVQQDNLIDYSYHTYFDSFALPLVFPECFVEYFGFALVVELTVLHQNVHIATRAQLLP